MASMKDAEQLTDVLSDLVEQLRSELQNGSVDFERLIEIADEISERADGIAGTFATVNEALMNRISELNDGSTGKSSSDSKSKSGSKS